MIFLLFIVACETEEPMIIKKDEPINTTIDETVEEANEQEDEQKIIISLADENVQLNLNKIPILAEYLSLAKNKTIAIQQLNLIPLQTSEQTIYLLEFACQNNHCSYLLIDENEKHSSILLADLAKYDDAFFSPDESLLAIKFRRNQDNSLSMGHVTIISLDQWKTVPLMNESEHSHVLHYRSPILSLTWIDDTTISVQTPRIPEFNDEGIQILDSDEGLTTDIIFQIEK